MNECGDRETGFGFNGLSAIQNGIASPDFHAKATIQSCRYVQQLGIENLGL